MALYKRRKFIGQIILVPLFFFMSKCTKANSQSEKKSKEKLSKLDGKKQDKRKLVEPGQNAAAKALSYVQRAEDSKKRKDESTFCHNCQLYTPVGKIDGTSAGKCQLITGGLVAANGWCQSWAQKKT